MFAVFRKRCGLVSDGHNDGIRGDFKRFAVFALNLDAIVGDSRKFRFKIYGHFVECEIFSQIRRVCKTYALDCNKVVLHLDDDGMLAF